MTKTKTPATPSGNKIRITLIIEGYAAHLNEGIDLAANLGKSRFPGISLRGKDGAFTVSCKTTRPRK